MSHLLQSVVLTLTNTSVLPIKHLHLELKFSLEIHKLLLLLHQFIH